MHRAPALLLLVALVGGLGASLAHEAHHAHEWFETQSSHVGDYDSEGDRASAPCIDGDVHASCCAVCTGLSGAIAGARLAVGDRPADAVQVAVEAAYAEHRRATTPARGPPAVA